MNSTAALSPSNQGAKNADTAPASPPSGSTARSRGSSTKSFAITLSSDDLQLVQAAAVLGGKDVQTYINEAVLDRAMQDRERFQSSLRPPSAPRK